MRNIRTNNKKRLISTILCSLFVMQQSLVYPAMASVIQDGAGNDIGKHPYTGNYEIRPDLYNYYNGKVGFKEFQKLQLSEGDVLNFIFQAYNGSVPTSQYWDIDTFVNFVNSQVNIQGVVNALTAVNGDLKQNGNLVFVSPEGMVVGGSGVLNVGSLSVFTPTVDAFNTLKEGMRTVPVNSYNQQMGETTNKTWDANSPLLYTGGAPIQIGVDGSGKVFARGNVELSGGQVDIGSQGAVIAGLGGSAATTVLANTAAADALFNQLVSTDNMVIGNALANANGEIKITSSQGMTVANGGTIRNFATNNSTTTITNNGANGININGEVSNPNGNMTITNNAGSLVVGANGNLKNKGTMRIVGQGANAKITIDGKATNDGNMYISNNVGAGGLNIGGAVTNNTGVAEITSAQGHLNVNAGGSVTSNGTSLKMENNGVNGLKIAGVVNNNNGTATITNKSGSTTGGLHVTSTGNVTSKGSSLKMGNSGTGGLIVDGQVNNNAGTVEIKNTNNKLLVSSTGRVNSKGSKIDVTNSGTNGMHIQGIVNHRNAAGTVNFTNSNSDMIIGHTNTDFNITSDADVNINALSGNVYNYGVVKTLIQTVNGADLNITASNGAIGKEVGPCADGVCTGIGGADARDLTKSINTEIDGIITANSKGSGALVNMASLNKDMHINQINSDRRVILLADHKTNKGSAAYNVVNRALDNTKPNVTGTGISIIASGNIGENGKALTFIQKNADFNDASWNADKFNYNPSGSVQGVDMLAIKDVIVKGLDNADGTKNDTNVCAIISRTGNIDAEFSGDTYIKDITAENRIDLVNRGKNMYIENLGQSPTYYPTKGDYYGNKTNVVPDRVHVTVLDLGTVSSPNNQADSTLVIKGGQINGDGKGRPTKDQDLTITVDNGYVDGYYFNMGKNRMPGHSTVRPDDRTNTITSPSGTRISVRGEAVRPYDVTDIGRNQVERNYYYGSDTGMEKPNGTGSEQGADPNYDGTDNPAGVDDDNLVIPVPGETDPGPDIPDDPDPVNPDDPDPVNPDPDPNIPDPDDPTDPTNPDNPDKPSNPDDPDPVDPTNPDKPVTPTDPDDPNTDPDPDKPVNPTDPTDPKDPTNPDKPVTPTDPDDPNADPDPDKPVNPTDPTDPTDPTNPDKPVTPTDPDDPNPDPDPDKPVNPTDPIDPTDPDKPVNPTDPTDPTDPTNPTNPDNPKDPTDPLDPADPEHPANPDNPVDPTKPDKPVDPDPVDPDKPVIPDKPEPDDPDEPNKPVNPDDPDRIPDPGPGPDDPNPPIPPGPGSEFDPDDPRPLFPFTYKQRVMEHDIDAMDKRLAIRVDIDESNVPLTLQENENIDSVVDISRGGMSVTHNDTLKVGDVVPVHITYGDIEIDANVKVVSASKKRAGTQFIDLDEATANKLLYLSLLMDGNTETKVTYTVGEKNLASNGK